MSSYNSVQKNDPSPALVLLLGMTGVGKSTFIKAASGLDVDIGDSLRSCTPDVQIFPIPNSQTFLIDTPGFDDPTRSDTDILQSIASCLADMHEGLTFEGVKVDLSGIIYIHPINEVRMMRPAAKNLKMFEHLAGEENMRNCILVTSKWCLEDVKVAEEREVNLLQCWKTLLEAGATVRKYEDSQRSAFDIINLVTRAGPFLSQLTREYVKESKELYMTTAGRAIDEDLAHARDHYEAELATLRREHKQYLQVDSTEAAEQLKSLSFRAEAKLKVMDDEMEQLRLTRDEFQNRTDELELMVSHSKNVDFTTAKTDQRRRRQKRAFRWFGRFTAMGAAVALSVLSAGAMTPVGLSLYVAVETICQADKDREARRQAGSSREDQPVIRSISYLQL